MDHVRIFTLALAALALLVSPRADARETPEALDLALRSASPGDILDLGFFTLDLSTVLNDAPDQIPLAGGRLFHSGNPEVIQDYGILYQDDLPPGGHRLFLSHINGMAAPVQLSVIFENLGSARDYLGRANEGYPDPSTDHFDVGVQTALRYHEYYWVLNTPAIDPGGTVTLADFYIFPGTADQNELSNVIMLFGSVQPLRVTAVAISPEGDPEALLPSLTPLPDNGSSVQGTFEQNTYANSSPLVYDTTDDIMRISFANPSVPDGNAELVGIDAAASAEVTLDGNFGVTYEIRVDLSSSDGRRLALLMKPGGFSGDHGGYFQTYFPYDPLHPAGEGIIIPQDTSADFDLRHGGLIRIFDPTTSPQTLLIKTFPTAGSSPPFDLILVPFDTPTIPAGLTLLGEDGQ